MQQAGTLVAAGAVTVTVDQLTKQQVRRHVPAYAERPVAPGVSIRHTTNHGTSWGLLERVPIAVPAAVAAGFGGFGILAQRMGAPAGLASLGTGMALGGAIGNIIDRAHQSGAVTDFVSVGSFPTFNVADAALVAGSATLGLAFVLGARKPAAAGAVARSIRP